MSARRSRPVIATPAKKRPAPRRRRGPATAAGEPDLIKMSELAKRSGVPAPTIKHYIREGLLPAPHVRTSRNMAYYDARIADRIRVIKQLQAERFLPLRVIGELLEPSPSTAIRADRDAEQRRALGQLAPMAKGLAERGALRTRTEIMQTFGVSRAELDSLEAHGVIELRGEGEGAGYGGVDLQLLDIYADVQRQGLSDVFPITIAEPYFAAVRKLVDFEIDMFRHRALSRPLPGSLPDVAWYSVQLGERLVVALRTKLLPPMLAEQDRPER
jgi:DNA-binding transcriptional MerR regulator